MAFKALFYNYNMHVQIVKIDKLLIKDSYIILGNLFESS